MTWQSETERTYVVESAPGLATGDWQSIATVPGESGTTSFTDTEAVRLARTASYYRVRRLP